MSPRTHEAIRKLDQAKVRMLVHRVEFWRHYKGGVYQFLGFTIHTETGGVLVRYRRVAGPEYDEIYDSQIEYSRPLEMWHDDVAEHEKRFKDVRRVDAYEDFK